MTREMLRSFQFSDAVLDGCVIKVKVGTDDSLTSIVAHCVERVLIILDNFNLIRLIAIVKNKQFKLDKQLHEIEEGDESEVFKIESYA